MIDLVETCRATIKGPERSWVLFEHGTCVILMQPEGDLVALAAALLRSFGPVFPGTPSGDFATTVLADGNGWVVHCHHNDILTFVRRDEARQAADDLVVGLLGRSKRGRDAEELRVLHVESKGRTS